ncbi:hypothetical protein ISG33_06425 [Glaciecola sp. MH2013]|uniref:hypothetical protein n=1 Tax=Glaciecola sp. MH2013 TaxID=2785524 RepID=UPI00189FC6A3|nr:hypothetical protein [Glaciecola sp. MH2013]MBF7073031.1 hypothetical protein [Glaciecola sp. MH2013]
MSLPESRVTELNTKQATVLSLVADADTKITLSDRPVFGVCLTFREDICALEGSIVYPKQVIGWIDYSASSKLACLHQHQYFDAQQFINIDSNEISFLQAVRIHEVNRNLNNSNQILTFSIVRSAFNNTLTQLNRSE